MFCEIRNAVAAEVERIQYCAYIVSVIDCLQSLAEVAQNRSYVKPLVDDGDVIEIKGGRHPVVEKMMDGQFIPNDTYFRSGGHQTCHHHRPEYGGEIVHICGRPR